MVKLRVHVRVISEDAFNEHLDGGRPVPAREEKAFKIIIREPTEWFVGALANEVKERYRNNYKHDLGQIKYLKDNEDADLDPEYFVSDVLVDEGKAAQDGFDQQVTIKVIREQGRGVRVGSVIPDLTPAHYRPPSQNLPPVPKFDDMATSLGKRKHAEVPTSQAHFLGAAKRQRLGQIEEEEEEDRVGAEHVHKSIEQSLDSGSHDIAVQNSQLSPASERRMLNYAQVKLESPQLGYDFSNLGPASTDELELLPSGPTSFPQLSAPRLLSQQQSATNAQKMPGLTDKGKSLTPGAISSRHSLTDEVVRKESPHQQRTPITPISDAQGGTTPRTAVSVLNKMKSASPKTKLLGSASVKKFARPDRDLYAQPESDIDDSQMSPNSRATTKIRPMLVPSAKGRESTRPAESMEVDEPNAEGDLSDQLATISEPAAHSRALQNAKKTKSSKANADVISGADSDHSNSSRGGSGGGGSNKKKKRTRKKLAIGQSQKEPRSSSATQQVASKVIQNGVPSIEPKGQGKIILADENSVTPSTDRDSPGLQLSESLQKSTPATKRARVVEFERSTRVEDQDDANSPSDSSDESETGAHPVETLSSVGISKVNETKKAPKESKNRKRENNPHRCLTCWTKSSLCDNARPKCTSCEKNKKTCQKYDLTKAEAERIRNDRKAQRESSTPVPKSAQVKSALTNQKETHVAKGTNSNKKTTDGATSPELTASKSEAHVQATQIAAQQQHASLPRVVTTKKDIQNLPHKTDKLLGSNAESASSVTKSHIFIPPWFTESEYETELKKREGMTEEDRLLKNQSSRSSAPRHSVTRDSDDETSNVPEKTANQQKKKAAETETSSRTQEDRLKGADTVVDSAGSKSAAEKVTKPSPSTNAAKPQMPRATGANTPFRSHKKKIAESTQPTGSSGTSTPVLNQSKSLADLKKQLELNRMSSTTSTPTIIKKVATPTNLGQKAVFDIDDDEDDDDSETESDEESGGKVNTQNSNAGKVASKSTTVAIQGPAKAQTTSSNDTSSDEDSEEESD